MRFKNAAQLPDSKPAYTVRSLTPLGQRAPRQKSPAKSLTVTFPGAPNLNLSPNKRYRRGGFKPGVRAVADLTGVMHFDILVQSLAPAEPLTGDLRYDATICWPKGQRALDFDSAVGVLKAYIDLLPPAGWMKTDFQIKAAHVTQIKEDGPGWVEVSISEIAEK